VSAEPHVCSTAVIPIRAPRRLGSAAMARAMIEHAGKMRPSSAA